EGDEEMKGALLGLAAVAFSLVLAFVFTLVLQTSFEPSLTSTGGMNTVLARIFGAPEPPQGQPQLDTVDRYNGPFDSSAAATPVARVWDDYDSELRRNDIRAIERFNKSFGLAFAFFLIAFFSAYGITRGVSEFVRWLLPQPSEASLEKSGPE